MDVWYFENFQYVFLKYFVYGLQGNVLVFVDKQEHADELSDGLMRVGYINCASLHGGIDQCDRDSTIVDFKSGKIKLLV